MENELMQIQITAQHIIAILSALGSLMVLILGGIWRELRGLREQLAAVVVKSARHDERITTLTERLDRLPCINCPRDRSND